MNLRNIIQKFWYIIWFVVIPLVIAWLVVDVLDRFEFVDEFEPWYVLLLFAMLVVFIYSGRERLPFWKDRDENSPSNRAQRIRAGEMNANRVRHILKKHPDKVTDQAKKELHALLDEIQTAIKDDKDRVVEELSARLEEGFDKYLAFARKSTGREYFESIGVAVIIALVLRLFAVEAFKIPSESMVPTLMVGDHIFVSKFRYGISIPFKNKQLVQFAAPAYGDVIVFAKPSRAEQGARQPNPMEMFDRDEMVGEDFIKRIVGLPGDKIEVKDSVVYVNDKPLPRCRVGQAHFKSKDDWTGKWVDESIDLWVEKHGDAFYTIAEEPVLDSYPPEVVPDGQIFVMGDNRDHSSDSRYWGTVPIDNIKGRAMIIWWSNKRPHGFEWHRVGTMIMGGPTLTAKQEAALGACAGF